MKKEISRKFCVAPMMGYTTPYARKLYRILSNNSFLFSEMIATKSLIYSKNKDNVIDNDFNNPVALQVGGSEIEDLINKNVYPPNKEDFKVEEDNSGSALGSIGLKPKIVH